MSITNPPNNYTALDIKGAILERMIAKGIQLEEATTIFNRGSLRINSLLDNASVDRLIEDYTSALVRLKKYADEANLTDACFLSMADSVARTINES